MAWTKWKDWAGGDPPVPEGTLIEAHLMVRAQDLRRAAPPHFRHLIFRTGNGDSFRLEPVLNTPGECVLLVYRFRVWEAETTVETMTEQEVVA
jgi:hypothetical protein